MRSHLYSALAALMAVASAQIIPNPYNNYGSVNVWVSPNAIINENIKNFVTPEITFIVLLTFSLFIPLLLIWFCMTHNLQTPIIFCDSGPEWGKIEEVE